MNVRNGFTKIDALVTITCLVILAVNIPVISAGGRGKAKIDVCKANLMQLTAAWHLYADDNSDKLVNAQIWKVNCNWPVPFGDTQPGSAYTNPADIAVYAGQVGWAVWPHTWNHNMLPSDGSKTAPHGYCGAYAITENAAKEEDWQHGIACGGLWKYIKDFRLYKCPVGEKKAYITYSVSMMINGQYCNNWCKLDASTGPVTSPCQSYVPNPPYRVRSMIKNAANRMLFLDTGTAGIGSWEVRVSGSSSNYFCWLSLPPVRHGNGTTLSFADGHCEYRKWVNPQTSITQWSPNGTITPCPQTCNQDLFYMQRIVCGGLSNSELAAIPPGCNTE